MYTAQELPAMELLEPIPLVCLPCVARKDLHVHTLVLPVVSLYFLLKEILKGFR